MKAGTPLPALSEELTPTRLVMYAGATWDWHALHYDGSFAHDLGLGAPIADGQMYGAFYASQMFTLLGPKAWIRRISLRFHSMVFAGETIGVVGEVEDVTEDSNSLHVTSTHRLLVGDRLCSSGSTFTVVPL